jgi:exosortase C (VPDSG-CTERM-specific)
MKPREQILQISATGERTGSWALHALPHPQWLRIAACVGWIVAATVAFGQQLIMLMLYASESGLYSYIPLVPVVSGYLLFIRRRSLETAYSSSIGGTVILSGIAVAALAAGIAWRASLSVNDGLALMALAYLSSVAAGGFLFLGSKLMAAATFPVAFLIFMVPLPDAVVNLLETASVMGSADVSAWLFRVTGTPLVRDGTVLALPGIVLQIAQECSGIRSSWVLFITSLLASHLFLEGPWRRIVLVAFVIPLAIVRNGFRILVIGLLCVHVGPHMIDSTIHRRGGPLFFVLSLGPLFLLLAWLRRQER